MTPAFRRHRSALAGSAALILLASGCAEKPAPAPPPVEVGFVSVQAQPITLTAELAGRISAAQVSEVRPQVNGLIRRRLFEEGAMVRAGQPLYEIDSALYRASRNEVAAQLASARAQLAAAEAEAARYQSLAGIEAVSAQAVDDARAAAGQARASVQQFEAALRAADINLSNTRILAPIGGRIGRSNMTEGALVTANQADPLATIQALETVYVDIQESSTRLLELRQALASGGIVPASAAVTIILEDGSEYSQPGVISFTEAVVDEATGAVSIRASVPNPDGLLLPGMFVRVRINEGVVPEGILAPQQAISRSPGGQATALVVATGDKVEQRMVTASRAIGDQWLITAGLKPGDRLIVEGTGKARPGAAVRPVPVKPSRT